MNPSDMRHLQRSGQWFVLALAVTLLALAAVVVSQAFAMQRPPPFEYSRDVYYPLAPVCPGQVLQWRSEYTFRMKTDFVTVRIARVLYDVQGRRHVAPDNELEYYVWTSTERRVPQSSVQKYTLPGDLPVGQYELRVGASASGTQDTGYRVPFVIPVSCKKGGTP